MRLLLAATVLVVACGPLRQLHRTPPPAPVAVAPTRPVPYPVFETKAFARAVNRDDLRRGAEEMGLSLEEHATNVIGFLRERADELGLRGTL